MQYNNFKKLVNDLLNHIAKKSIEERLEIVNSAYFLDRRHPKRVLATLILKHYNYKFFLEYKGGKLKDVSSLNKLLPHMDCASKQKYACLKIPSNLIMKK